MWKLFVLILISLGFLLLLFTTKPQVDEIAKRESVETRNTKNIDTSDDKYNIAWYKLQDTDKVDLKSNLDEKKTSTNIYKDESCKVLINSGFYSENGKHIGLFSVDDEYLGNFSDNRLFNTIIHITDDNLELNDSELESYDSAVQTGPRILESGNLSLLNLNSDKPARRMVYLSNGSSYFLSVYTKNNAYSGPFLRELGEVVLKYAERNNIQNADAVNLDGGSASAFITPDFTLTEISPIGSYFCIKN